MINRILEMVLGRRVLVLTATAVLVVVGTWSFLRLPIDAVPDITNVQVQINTRAEGLAPEEVEHLVTLPIELEMGGIPGLMETRSGSRVGLSQITLTFRERTDIFRARQLVAERLIAARERLPQGVSPALAPIITGLGEIYYYSLDYAPDAPNPPADPVARLLELRRIQDYQIKPQLRTVTGVTEVNSCGGYERQIQVLADPEKLRMTGMTFKELAEVIEENTENAPGNVVEREGQQVIIRSLGRLSTPKQIAAIPLKFRADGRPLLVGDVAEVKAGAGLRSNAASRNGREVVIGSALMLAGENSRTVARAVHAKINEIRTKLPPGVILTTEYNRSDLVDSTISTVGANLFEGGILVMVVLFGMLGNWRAALIVASAIPLSMLFAFTGMVKWGVSGNLMSLGAIDFGLIVDGAVVITECVARRLAEQRAVLGRPLSRTERTRIVLGACHEVGRPMVFGLVIITMVYLPILALTGTEGKMFRPMALTVIFALSGALVLTLTLIPVLCSLFLDGESHGRQDAIFARIQARYRRLLEWSLRHARTVAATSLALFGAGLFVYSRLGAEFIPQLNEGSFAGMLMRAPSVGLGASLAKQQESERLLLKEIPEIKAVFSLVGTTDVATCLTGVNNADTYFMLKSPSEWTDRSRQPRRKDELANAIKSLLSERIPSQTVLLSQPVKMRFDELLEGSRADLAVKIFGLEHDELERLALKVRDVVAKIRGAADVEHDAIGRTPMLDIVPDQEAAARYGVHAAEIHDLVGTAMAGRTAGFAVENNRRTDIVVRLSDDRRDDLEAYGQLPVRTHHGGIIALGQVARLTAQDRPVAIGHEAGQRMAVILVNLRGRDVESFVREAEARLRAEVSMPQGYFVEWGGQYQNLREARHRLMLVVPVALAMIYILILGALGSARQALLVLTGIPLAVTGGIFSMALRGLPFSISAAVGFIALSGVAVLNGLVLITCFNQLREQGRTVGEAIREGTLIRLRPVLMTALVASLGFVPMAIATGAGAEVQRPLATVVIGGILSSTFLTLVLLPILYLKWEQVLAFSSRSEKNATAIDD
ncbi:MAG: efflux RND transporter permease subunit [Verrucomicrobiia bacterium]